MGSVFNIHDRNKVSPARLAASAALPPQHGVHPLLTALIPSVVTQGRCIPWVSLLSSPQRGHIQWVTLQAVCRGSMRPHCCSRGTPQVWQARLRHTSRRRASLRRETHAQNRTTSQKQSRGAGGYRNLLVITILSEDWLAVGCCT